MYSNPDRALGEIKAIRTSALRPGAMVDLYNISRELLYRARMEKRFSQSTVASVSYSSVDSARRKLNLQVTPQTKSSHTDGKKNCALLNWSHPPMKCAFLDLVWKDLMRTVRMRWGRV